MLWLGSAAGFARVVDLVTMWIVLLLIGEEEVGAASIAWTVAVLVEAANGLGIGVAVLQAPKLERNQLDSAFWFMVGTAVLISIGVVAIGPLFAWYYEAPRLAGYFWFIAAKLIFVSTFSLPFQLLNRELRYKEIAAVRSAATLLAAMTRIGVAAFISADAWALVVGHSAHGLFVLLGVYWVRPFWPRFHFRFSEIRSLYRFGLRVAMTDMLNQAYRNLDYFIVGKVFGLAPLGIYRVAFDVAMEPAMAVGEVATRSALPVFARVATFKGQLADAFGWSLRMLGRFTVPISIIIGLVAFDLAPLIPSKDGGNFAAAALPMMVLSVAALMRSHYLLFPPVLQAVGRPGTALRFGALTLAFFVVFITLSLWLTKDALGITSVALAWVMVYPPLLFLVGRAGYLHAGLQPRRLLHAVAPTMAGGAAALGLGFGLRQALMSIGPIFRIGLVGVTVAMVFLGIQRALEKRPFWRLPEPPKEEETQAVEGATAT